MATKMPENVQVWEELADIEEALYDALEAKRWAEVRRVAAQLSNTIRTLETTGWTGLKCVKYVG